MDPVRDGTKHESPGRVLGTFFVLALFLAALGWIGKNLLVGSVDGPAKQREYFGERAPPFGLELAEALRLPTGDVFLRFARPEANESSAQQPAELILLEYQSRAAVDALFSSSQMSGMEDMGPMDADGGVGQSLKRWQADPSFAWHTTMKRDDIVWGEWRSKLLIERSFEKGGGWREEARVDLSTKGRPRVLLAHWGREVPVDEAALRELLATITLGPAGS